MTVTQDLALARAPGQPVLVGALDAFLPFVVHIGEAHHLRSDRTRRIVTAVFAPQRQARQPHGGDLDGLLRSNGTAHAEFAARFVRQDFCQLRRRNLEHSGQMRALVCRQIEFGRARPQGFDWRTDRQQLTVAVGHLPTVRRQRKVAIGHRIALALQIIGIETLQIEGAPGHHRQPGSSRPPTVAMRQGARFSLSSLREW